MQTPAVVAAAEVDIAPSESAQSVKQQESVPNKGFLIFGLCDMKAKSMEPPYFLTFLTHPLKVL